MTRRNRPEQALQIATASYLDLALPKDAVWFHPPNGGARSKAEAGIFKAMGVKPGVPDIIIIWRGRVIAIELKAPNGRLSTAQKDMHAYLTQAGAFVYTATDMAGVEGYLRGHDIALRATTGVRAA